MHQNSKWPGRGEQHQYPEDEADRNIRLIGEWICTKFKESKLVDVVQMVVSIVLAIAGIIGLYIYKGQLKEMQYTNKLTQIALGRADQNSLESSKQFQVQLRHFDASLGQEKVIAAQTVSQARQVSKLVAEARRSIDDNKAAQQLEESPWLHTQGVLPTDFPDGNQALAVQIINSGKSPAFRVHALVVFQMFPVTDPPPKFIFQEKDAKGELTFYPNPLYPDQLRIQGLIPVSWINAYKGNQLHAYIGLEMWYRDYWGKQHDDRACFFFQPETQSWVSRKPDHCED